MLVDPQLLANARKFIGHTGPKHTDEVTRKEIRRFAISIGDDNPLYFDDAYAKAAGYQSVIAPPMFHCAFALPDERLDKLEPSGVGSNMGPRFEVPVPGFGGAVAGGREITLGEPMCPGDVITHEEKVVDVYAKEGKAGPLIFIITEYLYTNQRGQMVVKERQTLIRHQ